MASMLKYYQPAPRFFHSAAPIGDRLYMWGGRTEDFSESSRRKLASVVEIYDPYLEAWQQEATTGVPPPGLYAGGCTAVHESLLWYGGYDDISRFGILHQLNTVTLNWEELHPKCMSHGPMAKTNCGLVLFQGGKVGLFGGYGTPTGPSQPGSTLTRSSTYSDGSGWTNEFHLFDLQEGVWSSSPTTGSRPPPCAAFTFTAIDSNRGVLFGGNSPEHGMMNDVYIINVQTMHWTKLDKSGGGPWPVGRSLHAACCLSYEEEHPQLLVSGGLDEDDNTLRDLWVLDVEAGTWKELALPEGTQPRWGHTTTAFNLSPGVVEVTMIGGSPKYVPGALDQQQPKIAETTVVRLESSASGGAEWVVKSVSKGRQLGAPERIREKIEVKTAVLLSSELAGERENVRKAESKITELEEKVESAETRVRIALARAVRAEIRCDRIPHLEQQLQQHLHTKEEELKALTTQYRATCDTLLRTQEQLSTQQLYMQYTAHKTQDQLQAKVHENTALHTHSQALANQVVTLQSQVTQLEQTMQATQAALAQIPHLETVSTQTDTSSVGASQITQAGLQTGAFGPTELPIQHAKLQQRVAGETEVLLTANEEVKEKKEQMRVLQADKQELEQQLQIKSIENQEQKKQLTTLEVEKQEIAEQVKALQLEKSNLEENLAKEAFLETALGYEVDALREDVMDRQQVEFHNTSSQTVVDDVCIPGTSLTGFLRGAEVVVERDFVITNQARSYHWDEYGFRLHVPEGSLEAGLSETTVNVRVSLSGQFQLPADSELVSAVYWVFSPHVFSQPLTVDVQHCAAPSQSSNLSFIRTKCTQQELPYQFKELEGGSFSQQGFYGSISVNHFSGIGIKRKRSKEVSDDYCAQLYKSRKSWYDCQFSFAVTKNLEACFSVVDQKYCTGHAAAEFYTSFTFGFKEEEISLDIPSCGIKDKGWKIFPLFPPTVTKDAADMFKHGKRSQIPHCDLMLRWTKDKKPTVPLDWKIGIRGATKDYFILCNDISEIPSPVSISLPSPTESMTSQKGMELSINDLRSVLTAVFEVSTKWYYIGLVLEVAVPTLDRIGSQIDPSDRLLEMLKAWLETAAKPTWQDMVNALRDVTVGHSKLASDIETEYCTSYS